MKKSALVLVGAFVFVLAIATTALATTSSDYAAWSSAGANAGSLGTPHKDYRTTTVKCAVCHAVHKASSTGNILLRSTAGGSCAYCHIQNNYGNIVLYGGQMSWYGDPASVNGAHDNACTQCHAVHGAGTINTGGQIPTLEEKILKASPVLGATTYNPQAGTPWNYATANRNEAVSRFCSTCHPYYAGGYEGTVSGSLATGGTYKTHIMTSTINAYGNPNKTTSAAQVAYVPDPYCRSCHDAGTENYNAAGTYSDSFPHYTLGQRFLKSKAFRTDASADATNSAQDGVCLKCHRDSSAATGAGTAY